VSTGTIHDLGYKRYVGTRRRPSTRWRVITRHKIAMAWKSWWRLKLAIGLAAVATLVWGGIFYFTNRTLRSVGTIGGAFATFTDAAVPLSFQMYCWIALYASFTFGATTIAGDVQSGAFTFYFARSVRPRDYVVGTLASFVIPIACILVVAPLLLSLVRLGMVEDFDQVLDHISVIPKALFVGTLAALAYATVPLAFSSLVPNRRTALALWAAYYIVFGTIVQQIGSGATGGAIAMLDIPTAVQTLAYDTFDIHFLWGRRVRWAEHTTAATISLVMHAVASIAIVWYRVTKAQKAGVGGAS
jgi:hypothetical protein